MVVNVQGHRAQQGRAASLSKKLLTSSVAICQGGLSLCLMELEEFQGPVD